MYYQYPENYIDSKKRRLMVLQINQDGVTLHYFCDEGVQTEYFCAWNDIEQIWVEDDTLRIYGIPTWKKHFTPQSVTRPWLWEDKGYKHKQVIPLPDEKDRETVAAEIEKYRKITAES